MLETVAYTVITNIVKSKIPKLKCLCFANQYSYITPKVIELVLIAKT